MRRRIARLRDSGNLAWSIAATIISLIAIAPVLAILVLALQSSGDTWPHQAGAAQIACIMLAFVFAMITIERAMRANLRYHHTTGRSWHLPEDRLQGSSGVFAAVACALPILLGLCCLLQSSFMRRHAL